MTPGGARIGVSGGVLDVAQAGPGVQVEGDEGVAQPVGGQRVGKASAAPQAGDDLGVLMSLLGAGLARRARAGARAAAAA